MEQISSVVYKMLSGWNPNEAKAPTVAQIQVIEALLGVFPTPATHFNRDGTEVFFYDEGNKVASFSIFEDGRAYMCIAHANYTSPITPGLDLVEEMKERW